MSFSILSRKLSEQYYKSLLRLISAQDIPLKNKLLGKPKLAAFSLIFFRVAQRLMGSSFWQEDKSTVIYLPQSSEWWAANLCWNGDYSSSWFFSLYPVSQTLKSPRKSTKIVRFSTDLSRRAYFKNASESRFIGRNGSNEWSLSDYKRRVSSTATIEASYEARAPFTMGSSIFGVSPRSPQSQVLASNQGRSDILGLAAGGQMYGARDLRPLIVSLISRTECRKYTVTQTRLGYSSMFS